MTEPTNADIMMALGGLTADIKNIKEEMAISRDNRKVIYDRMEEQGRTIAEMSVRLQIASDISSKARDEVKKMTDDVDPLLQIANDLKSVVTFQKDASKTGKVLIWLITIGGASVLAFAAWFAELIKVWVLSFLGIPPPGA